MPKTRLDIFRPPTSNSIMYVTLLTICEIFFIFFMQHWGYAYNRISYKDIKIPATHFSQRNCRPTLRVRESTLHAVPWTRWICSYFSFSKSLCSIILEFRSDSRSSIGEQGILTSKRANYHKILCGLQSPVPVNPLNNGGYKINRFFFFAMRSIYCREKLFFRCQIFS